MVKRYRKKPVIVDAVQWTGDNPDEIRDFCGDAAFIQTYDSAWIPGLNQSVITAVIIIRTLEGDMVASKGDYIIRGVDGEHYPCKPDIFEKTYEGVD